LVRATWPRNMEDKYLALQPVTKSCECEVFA